MGVVSQIYETRPSEAGDNSSDSSMMSLFQQPEGRLMLLKFMHTLFLLMSFTADHNLDDCHQESESGTKRRKLSIVFKEVEGVVQGMLKRGILVSSDDHSDSAQHETSDNNSKKVSKNTLRRMAAKTQHSTAPMDDIEELRRQLSEDESDEASQIDEEEEPNDVEDPDAMAMDSDDEPKNDAVDPKKQARLDRRRRKDAARKRAKRKIQSISRAADVSKRVVDEMAGRLERGKTTWRTPLMDPEHDRIARAVGLCEFTEENGFKMNEERVDMAMAFRKPHYANTSQFFDDWCLLCRVYLDEMLANPSTAIERDMVAKGNAHPETSIRKRNQFLHFWHMLSRFSCYDPVLAAPIKDVWSIVRPARLFGLLCFLREFYTQPNRNPKTFQNKLFLIQHFLTWLQSKPELSLSKQQMHAGVMSGRVGDKYVPPPEGSNTAILHSFACDTDAEASQCSYWIASALEEVKKLIQYATNYALADPQPKPNETGLRKVGDWPSRALFKATLRDIQSRLDEFKKLVFWFDEDAKMWRRSKHFKKKSQQEQDKLLMLFQEYLISVTIIALHGSRRQVAMNMKTSNVAFSRDKDRTRANDLATLAINFKEKVQSRKHMTLPLNERYFDWFQIYQQAILPRIAYPKDSVAYWRQSNGVVMSPSSFTRIHQKVWFEVGVSVQNGDKKGVPTGFSPLQIRRWTITEFFNNETITEAQLTDYASIMNTSVDMMRKYYNRQKSELKQLAVTKTIAQVLDAEMESEVEEEEAEEE